MNLPGSSIKIVVADDLFLTLLSEDSAAPLFKSIDTNRHQLRKWLPFVDNTWKIEDTEMFIKSILHTSGPKPDLVYEIRYREQFAGLIALKEIDRWNKRTELGYWLDPHWQGQGLMTKCCKALMAYAFKNMKMNRIQIKVGIGNASSSRIPEKLGFKFEGIERHGEKFHDHYIDLEVYSMLRHDWKS